MTTTTRTMVFVDAANPFYGAKQEISQKAHFDAVSSVEDMISGRNCVGVHYYDGVCLWENEVNDMHDDIERRGYDLQLREQIYNSKKREGSTQKEVDMTMGRDILLHAVANDYDEALIVSGDRDFFPMVEAIRAMGKRVVVAAFKSEISEKMMNNCDEFIDLNTVPCIKIVSSKFRYGAKTPVFEIKTAGVHAYAN